MRPKTPAQKALTSTAVAVLETDPQVLFVAEVKVVARERIVRGQRFTPADVATVLEAYRGEVIPDAISEWAISGLRYGALGEVGRPGTSVHDEAALRVAHREYKALLRSCKPTPASRVRSSMSSARSAGGRGPRASGRSSSWSGAIGTCCRTARR